MSAIRKNSNGNGIISKSHAAVTNWQVTPIREHGTHPQMKFGGKIIIKPRLARQSANASGVQTSAAPTPSAQPSSEGSDDVEEGEIQEQPPPQPEPAPTVTTITPRPRGRPRGSGRGRPRGGRGVRGGTGSGSGGGGALTIRLPKLGGEEGQIETEGATTGADGAAESTAEGDEVEKEAPMGGGKPFRKIQGKVYIIENDEFVTDDDQKGDTKIDKNGNLLGGRPPPLCPPSRPLPLSRFLLYRSQIQSLNFHSSPTSLRTSLHASY
jgi:hypothetical protein